VSGAITARLAMWSVPPRHAQLPQCPGRRNSPVSRCLFQRAPIFRTKIGTTKTQKMLMMIMIGSGLQHAHSHFDCTGGRV